MGKKRQSSKADGSQAVGLALSSIKLESSDHRFDFFETMFGESDRGCLLVGLAEIDATLGRIIEQLLQLGGSNADAAWLVDSKAGGRPLGTLAVRTHMARCMGVFGEELHGVIDAIRALRNKHAHGTSEFKLTQHDADALFAAWTAESQAKLVDLMTSTRDTAINWRGKSQPMKVLIASVAVVRWCLQLHILKMQETLPRLVIPKRQRGSAKSNGSGAKLKTRPNRANASRKKLRPSGSW